MQFGEFIKKDRENEFCNAIMFLLNESFELVKKNQVKRNTKSLKIANLQQQMTEMDELEEQDEEDLEIKKKLEEQKKGLEEEIKDTVYI